jgi:hypothetical protein
MIGVSALVNGGLAQTLSGAPCYWTPIAMAPTRSIYSPNLGRGVAQRDQLPLGHGGPDHQHAQRHLHADPHTVSTRYTSTRPVFFVLMSARPTGLGSIGPRARRLRRRPP